MSQSFALLMAKRHTKCRSAFKRIFGSSRHTKVKSELFIVVIGMIEMEFWLCCEVFSVISISVDT